jgi:hypothetical protein
VLGAVMPSDIFTDVKTLETKLGLPADFYDGLIGEDDWSFVIKLNALIEAACTHALAARLHAPELISSLAHLDLGNSKYGKVSLLRKLGAITSEQASILQSLYELRNDLAHNITQVSFSFSTYLGGLQKQQRTNFIKRAGHGIKDVVGLKGKSIPRSDFVLQNPKLALWMTVAEIIACLYLEFEIAETRLQSIALETLQTK